MILIKSYRLVVWDLNGKLISEGAYNTNLNTFDLFLSYFGKNTSFYSLFSVAYISRELKKKSHTRRFLFCVMIVMIYFFIFFIRFLFLAHLSSFELLWSHDVRHPSSCVSASTFWFIRHFLWNHLTKVNTAWQGCSLHEALPDFLKKIQLQSELWLLWQPKEKSLKIFFSETTRPRA